MTARMLCSDFYFAGIMIDDSKGATLHLYDPRKRAQSLERVSLE